MRHELPNRPHLDHLKAQAKELLDGHRRRDTFALERIREALPALQNATDERIAASHFALHDAQSVIAREYGFPSFAKLRAHVLAAASPYPAELVESLLGTKLVPEVEAALREVWAKRDVEALDALPTPATLPLLAVRNALLSPGALAPIRVGRAVSISALSAAVRSTPSFVAVYAQRTPEAEHPTAAELHDVGCLGLVRWFQTGDDGQAWVVLEGVRFIELAALVATDPHYVARVTVREVDEGDRAEIAALDHELRDGARRLARALPVEPEAAVALIDGIDDTARLSDLVVANLPCTVAEKAAYAAETTLATRLRSAIRFVERELAAKAGPVGGSGGTS